MEAKRIEELSKATELTGEELLLLEQSGEAKHTTGAELKAWIESNLESGSANVTDPEAHSCSPDADKVMQIVDGEWQRCFSTPSGKTDTLGLYLWEGEDYFLRSEFNENITILDKAMAKVASKLDYGVILDTTTRVKVSSMELNLSNIDLTSYWKGELLVSCTGELSELLVRVNGLASGYAKLNGSDPVTNDQTSLAVLRNVDCQPWRLEFSQMNQGVYVSVHGTQFHFEDGGECWAESLDAVAPVCWENLKTIQLIPAAGTLPVGTHITIRGVKK